jgi:hypothetical protein
MLRDNTTFSVVAENRLGSSTRDWRINISNKVKEYTYKQQQEEEEENVYEDLSVYSARTTDIELDQKVRAHYFYINLYE